MVTLYKSIHNINITYIILNVRILKVQVYRVVRVVLAGQYTPGRIVRLNRLPPFLQSGRAPQGQFVELSAGHEHEFTGPNCGPAAPAESDVHWLSFVLLLHPVVFFGRQTVRLGGHHAYARHVAVIGNTDYGTLDNCQQNKNTKIILIFHILRIFHKYKNIFKHFG